MTDWSDDEELMEELHAALDDEKAASARLRDAARGAFVWRSVDEDLLRLTHDSALGEGALVRGGGTRGPRTLTFRGAGLELEVAISADQVVGQVLPARTARVAVTTVSGESRSAEADDAGFFLLAPPAQGPLRVELEIEGLLRHTEWIPV